MADNLVDHFFASGEGDLQYPVHAAAREGRLQDLTGLLLSGKFDVNKATFEMVRPLHEACLAGHLDCVDLLIKQGADVNLRNIDGATALCDACLNGYVDIVELLIQSGANVNPPFLMSTPVHEAVFKDNCKCLEVILKYGADMDKSDCHYGTPLHIAAYKGHVKSAEILLRSGANPNVSKTHLTPLHVAADKQDLGFVTLLLDHGADVYARNSHGLTAMELVHNSTSPCKLYLQEWEKNPKTLSFHCRKTIRQVLGSGKLQEITKFALPKSLIKYLQFA